MNARITTLRLSLMLVSRVCLGINAFDGKGRKTWQAFQQLGSGMLNFPVSTLLFFLASLFYGPFLDSLQNVKHRHACVIVPLPIPFFLPLSTFYLLYLPPA